MAVLTVVLLAGCGASAGSRHEGAVQAAVPGTGAGFPIERADLTPQDLALSGGLSGHVTQARAVCVHLQPPPVAEFAAEILFELGQGRYLLLMSVRPYAGPGHYRDAGGSRAEGEPVAAISLAPWRNPPTEVASRPRQPSSFDIDGSELAGYVEAAGFPVAGGTVAIKGSWRCLPLH